MNIAGTLVFSLSVLFPLITGRIGHSSFGTNRVKRSEGSPRDWQWYLKNTEVSMNVRAAWNSGYTGKGVLVAVVDDGVNMNHPDLEDNFNVDSSYDFLTDKNISRSHSPGSHGTSCAGIIAGRKDTNCGVGIAYNSQISGIRMHNKNSKLSDQIEAAALGFRNNFIDIYSNSWGPGDMGWHVEGPGPRLAQVLKNGTRLGRHNKGSIFVFAAGNGGVTGDSCAFNGYVNSIYTIAISGVNWDGKVPGHAEPCAAIMAVTYGEDKYDRRKAPVITAKNTRDCTEYFPGTSASAAMASGIIALALEANPSLTWRDIQHLIARSSKPLNPPNRSRRNPDWKVNNASLQVSDFYGFGLMDAYDMVRYAKNWSSVAQQLHCEVNLNSSTREIPWSEELLLTLTVNRENCGIRFLEHVEVQIDLTFPRRGNLKMFSESPGRTRSQLLYPRAFDSIVGTKNFTKWTVSSLHYWGEDPIGDWKILIENSKPGRKPRNAVLAKFSPSSESPTKLTVMKSRAGNYSDWSSWSPCSVPCGDGHQTRHRSCTMGSQCIGDEEEERYCTSGICPTQRISIDGGYSPWSHWSRCSKTCGEGSQQRSRRCNNPPPANGGADCRRLGKDMEKRSCRERRCPVNGGYTEWSSWSSCSKSCNGGTQRRVRYCSNPTPAHGGRGCWRLGRSTQRQACNTHQCPGHLFSLKLILHGTKEDPLANNPLVDRRRKVIRNVDISARIRDIPVHGGYTPWSRWRPCTKSCGGGMQISTRSCSNPKPENKGKDCKGPSRRTRSCNSFSCPVDGGYTEWSSWSSCSKSCNRGTQRRDRECSNPTPAHGGRGCWRLGQSTQTQACNTHPCPVTNTTCQNKEKNCRLWKNLCKTDKYVRDNCEKTCGTCPVAARYSDWSPWSVCNVTCGGGNQIRTRLCLNPPLPNGESPCVGSAKEERICGGGMCPKPMTNTTCQNKDNGCSLWKHYCKTSKYVRDNCEKTCGTCPVAARYSDWSPWSVCNVTCGGGNQIRTRLCLNPPLPNGESPCAGSAKEERICGGGMCPKPMTNTTCQNKDKNCRQWKHLCKTNQYVQDNCEKTCGACQGTPIDGGYSPWSPWSRCSKPCAGGFQQRVRTCTNPSPANGGADCRGLGLARDTRGCNNHRCPIDGGYTEWSSWSSCSKSCNRGTQHQFRYCSNPTPAHGGRDCWRLGQSTQTQACNTHPCPGTLIDGGYSPWSPWSRCSKPCAGGFQQRFRTCTNPSPANGGADCRGLGLAMDTRGCNHHRCPIDGGYTEWSSWSSCSKSCNRGTQRQFRYCSNPTPAHGGRGCWRLGPNARARRCNTHQCPATSCQDDYTSCSSWKNMCSRSSFIRETCSKTCGSCKV